MRQNRPGSLAQLQVNRRFDGNDLARHLDCLPVFIELKEILGSLGQDSCYLLMSGIGRRKTQRAVDGSAMPGCPVNLRELLFLPCIRKQRGVTGLISLPMERVAVGRALILHYGFFVATAVKEYFSQQEVVPGGIRIVREGIDVVTVIACGPIQVLGFLRLLCHRMIMFCQIHQVGLDVWHEFVRHVLRIVQLPIR